MDQKVALTDAADQHLEEMLRIVNDGFNSGRVKKAQLAAWIISQFFADTFTKQIEKIRADHFDELAHLKAIVKKMEEAKKTDSSIELDKLLSPLRSRETRKAKIGS